jgi:hypothetical protein
MRLTRIGVNGPLPKALPKETGGGEAVSRFPSFLLGDIDNYLGILLTPTDLADVAETV